MAAVDGTGIDMVVAASGTRDGGGIAGIKPPVVASAPLRSAGRGAAAEPSEQGAEDSGASPHGLRGESEARRPSRAVTPKPPPVPPPPASSDEGSTSDGSASPQPPAQPAERAVERPPPFVDEPEGPNSRLSPTRASPPPPPPPPATVGRTQLSASLTKAAAPASAKPEVAPPDVDFGAEQHGGGEDAVLESVLARRAALFTEVAQAEAELAEAQEELEEAKRADYALRWGRLEPHGDQEQETEEDVAASVVRVADRIAAMREALAGDDAALDRRLQSQSKRVHALRADVEALSAAVDASKLELAVENYPHLRTEAALRQAVVDAKVAQQRALQAAAEEHEREMTQAFAECEEMIERADVETRERIGKVINDETELRRQWEQLSKAAKLKRAEALAAGKRRRELLEHVRHLQATLVEAHELETDRLRQAHEEVAKVHARVLEARKTRVDLPSGADEDVDRLALVEAEATAGARAKWERAVARATQEGEERIVKLKSEVEQKYKDAVAELEKKYVSDFETTLAEVRDQHDDDVARAAKLEEEVAALSRQVAELSSQASEEEALRAEEERSAVHREAVETKQLEVLMERLVELWREKGTPTTEVMAFMRRIQAATPYTPEVRARYVSKIEELRMTAPLVQSVTRREVLKFRLDHLKAAVAEVLESSPEGRDAQSERLARLEKLKREYDRESAALHAANLALWEDIRGFEHSHGKPFLHRQRRYADVMREEGFTPDDSSSGSGVDASIGEHALSTSKAE